MSIGLEYTADLWLMIVPILAFSYLYWIYLNYRSLDYGRVAAVRSTILFVWGQVTRRSVDVEHPYRIRDQQPWERFEDIVSE
jgi:hypothetical protein